MRILDRTLVFGMELHAEEKRVHAGRQRHGFHEFHVPFFIDSHALQAGRFEIGAVGVVEFVAVAVALGNFVRPVR